MKELSDYDKKRLRKLKSIIVFLSIFFIYGIYSVIGSIVIKNIESLMGSLMYSLVNGVWLYLEIRHYKKIKYGNEYDGLDDWEIELIKEDLEDEQ